MSCARWWRDPLWLRAMLVLSALAKGQEPLLAADMARSMCIQGLLPVFIVISQALSILEFHAGVPIVANAPELPKQTLGH